MNEVTRILNAIGRGDRQASDSLLPLVYEELRRLAASKLGHERPGQTLQATALVHEAYLRLVDAQHAQDWSSQGHFFCAAAEAMRRILIDRARRRLRDKHGAGRQRIDFEQAFPANDEQPAALLAVDEALARLEARFPEQAQLVKLRHYAGCTLAQAAAALGISEATAKRHWAFCRAQLFRDLSLSE